MRKIVLYLFGFTLIFFLVFSLGSCSSKIKATNLMANIEKNEVNGKKIDDSFIDSQFDLSVKLFKETFSEKTDQNTLISPLSIALSLAMTLNGASGSTKTEMENLVGKGLMVDEINEYFYSYLNSLPQADDYKLQLANSIWYKDSDNLNIKKDFLQTNADYFSASIYKSPFDKTTVKDINNWCKINTNSMIDKIVDEISEDSIMYLINALAFDAKWDEPYEEDDIFDAEFKDISNQKEMVSMMKATDYGYFEDENAKGFIKNYKDKKYSFVAILPNEDISIVDYIKNLNNNTIINFLNNYQSVAVDTIMPKFEYDYEISLNDCLKRLNMAKAFDSQEADFSNMGISSQGNIHIGNVLHKTYIKVDELGTKAGAVTKVEMTDESTAIGNEYKVDLNRPFLYLIIENENKLPLFMGAVLEIK